MSRIVFRPCYIYPEEAESVMPDLGSWHEANEAAKLLPAVPCAELMVSEYEVGDDGLSSWRADYRLGETKPCYTKND
jgi:hypothetical protein